MSSLSQPRLKVQVALLYMYKQVNEEGTEFVVDTLPRILVLLPFSSYTVTSNQDTTPVPKDHRYKIHVLSVLTTYSTVLAQL